MIKWLVKRYLIKVLENKKYQRLSLEQELGYASKLLKEDEIEMLEKHNKVLDDINAIIRVLEGLK